MKYFALSINSLPATLSCRFLISFNSIYFPLVGSYSTFCSSFKGYKSCVHIVSYYLPWGKTQILEHRKRGALTWAEELIWWKVERGPGWALCSVAVVSQGRTKPMSIFWHQLLEVTRTLCIILCIFFSCVYNQFQWQGLCFGLYGQARQLSWLHFQSSWLAKCQSRSRAPLCTPTS